MNRILLPLVLLAACGDDPSGPDTLYRFRIDAAQTQYVYTDPVQRIEYISGEPTYVLSLLAGGEFRGNGSYPAAFRRIGLANDTTLFVTDLYFEWEGTWQVVGTELRLDGKGGRTWSFFDAGHHTAPSDTGFVTDYAVHGPGTSFVTARFVWITSDSRHPPSSSGP